MDIDSLLRQTSKELRSSYGSGVAPYLEERARNSVRLGGKEFRARPPRSGWLVSWQFGGALAAAACAAVLCFSLINTGDFPGGSGNSQSASLPQPSNEEVPDGAAEADETDDAGLAYVSLDLNHPEAADFDDAEDTGESIDLTGEESVLDYISLGGEDEIVSAEEGEEDEDLDPTYET